MLFESLFAALSVATAQTAAQLGTGIACRLYPGQAPAGVELPYAVMTVVGGIETPTHDSATGPTLSDVQFSIVAGTYRGAAQVRAALRGDLDGAALAEGEQVAEFDERDGYSDATDQHVLLLTASIWHTPPTTVST